MSEVLALLAGARLGGHSPRGVEDTEGPVPQRKRSADDAGLASYAPQRRLSVEHQAGGVDASANNGGAGGAGAGAAASEARAGGGGGVNAGFTWPGSGSGGGATHPDVPQGAVSRMRVGAIRRELGRRGLNTIGRRAGLVERLSLVVAAEEREAAAAAAAERGRLEEEARARRFLEESDM